MRTGRMRSPIAALVPALVLLAAAVPARAADQLPVARGEPLADPVHATTVYLPVLASPSRLTEGQELWRSDDAGATFHPVLVGKPFDPHEAYPPPVEPPVAVAADGQLLVAFRDGTLRRSTDGGASWSAAPALDFVSALAFGPGVPTSAVFAVVTHPPIVIEGDRRLAAASTDGLYRLDGDRWRRVLAGDVVQVVPHPTDASRVYATTAGAVFRSDDGGATFRRVAARRTLLRLVVDAARPDRLLGMDDEDALLRSVDAGATWTRVDLPLEPQAVAQPVAAAPERVLVAAADNDPEEEPSLLASDDFGATWHGLPPRGPTSFDAVAISAADPARAYARTLTSVAQEAIVTSADGGASWSAHGALLDGRGPVVTLAGSTVSLRRTAGGAERPRVRIRLRLAPEEGAYVEGVVRLVARLGGRDATVGSGFFESDGGHALTAGVRIGPRAAARLRAAGRVDGLVRISATDDTEESSTRWERVTIEAARPARRARPRAAGPTPFPWALGTPVADPRDPSVVYLPGETGPRLGRLHRPAVWRSDDGGATLRLVLAGPASAHPAGLPVVAVAADGEVLAWLPDGRLQRSRDGGASWTSAGRLQRVGRLAFGGAPGAQAALAVVEPPPIPGDVDNVPPWCVERDAGRPGLYRLDGARWARVVPGHIREVLPYPADPQLVYATGLCATLRSEDGGATFRQISREGASPLVVDAGDPDRLLGITIGSTLSASEDGGATWNELYDAPYVGSLAQPTPGAPQRVVVSVYTFTQVPEPPRLVVSNDFGATWRDLVRPGKTTLSPLVTTADPTRLYAIAQGALATSTDGGRTWSAHGLPFDHRGPEVALAAPVIRLQRADGGRQRPRVAPRLRIGDDERGQVDGFVALEARIDGRTELLGYVPYESRLRRVFAVPFPVDRALATRLRQLGRVPATATVDAYDDLGYRTKRVLQLTIEA